MLDECGYEFWYIIGIFKYKLESSLKYYFFKLSNFKECNMLDVLIIKLFVCKFVLI